MENRQLKKDERLHLRKDIDPLFTSGHSFVVYPFRVIYRIVGTPCAAPVSILISIPKRRFRRAVWRNRLRRRTREAYRLCKETLRAHVPDGQALHIAFLYISNEPAAYALIEKKMQEILSRLAGNAFGPAAGKTAENP
ncbi:MAG: ribonuclease P protein component [Coprobacter sp.]|nr:ribonuclease P protein component [Coprobacter sp.]